MMDKNVARVFKSWLMVQAHARIVILAAAMHGDNGEIARMERESREALDRCTGGLILAMACDADAMRDVLFRLRIVVEYERLVQAEHGEQAFYVWDDKDSRIFLGVRE